MAKKTKDSNLSLEERLEQALIPNWDEPYKLPSNWCWVKLDSISEILNGYAFKSSLYTESGIRIIRITNVQDGFIEDEKPVFYPFNAKSKIEQYILKNNDLLMSLTGNVGRVALIKEEFLPAALNQRVACLRKKSSTINTKYLFYCLLQKQFIDDCSKSAKGSAQLNMSTEWLKGYSIPLPPTHEQLRIVEQIESLFAKLDEAREKAQEVVDGFETRKAAILHKAFSGELTAKWRKENGVTKDSWNMRKINQVSTPRAGYAFDSKKFTSTGYQIIRMGNLYAGELDLNRNPVYISTDNVDDSVLRRALINDGDILITLTGTKYKRDYGYAVCIQNPTDLLVNQRILCLTPHSNEIYTDFFLFYLQSDLFRDVFFSNETGGVNQGNVSSKFVENITFAIPTMDEQKEIGQFLRNILDKDEEVKKATEAVIEQIDTMKKAILARAFRGELGTNDPSEESAIELLKQALAEDTVVQAPTKKPTKRISIPSNIKELLSNIREEEIIKLLLKSAPQPVSIQEIMALSSKKFELMDALRSLEKKRLITKTESGEYSLTR